MRILIDFILTVTNWLFHLILGIVFSSVSIIVFNLYTVDKGEKLYPVMAGLLITGVFAFVLFIGLSIVGLFLEVIKNKK